MLCQRESENAAAKKTKDIPEEEKYKAFFEGEEGFFVIEKLTRDTIERCKLPKGIKFRKKLYNIYS